MPHGVTFSALTRDTPQRLPAGIALYYWIGDCYGCDVGGIYDVRRIVFDEAVGAIREDSPLTFLDGERDPDSRGLVKDFDVSESGQEMAAMICHVGSCLGAYADPSPDAEQHLWMSRDGGRTWSDLGQVLPGANIDRVSREDVLISEWNYGGTREEWVTRSRWAISGEAYTAPHASPQARAPDIGMVLWTQADARSDGAVAWTARSQGDHLLAIARQGGAVHQVFGAHERVRILNGGPPPVFATDTMLVRDLITDSSDPGRITAGVEIIDLARSLIYEAEGLSLPMDFDPSDPRYYYFIAARPPAVPAETTRPEIDFTPLTLGAPRELPDSAALYFAQPAKEGYPRGVTRAVFDGRTSAFTTDRPWVFFDDRPGYVTSFMVSDDGSTMAAAVCEEGRCADCYAGPSEDASLHLRVSRNGDLDWEDWGEVPQGAYISAVTGGDVAVTAWPPDADARRLWWVGSGEDVEPPAGLDASSLTGWRWAGGQFLWDYRGDVPVTDSGSRVPSPEASLRSSAKDTGWQLDEVRSDGVSLWTRGQPSTRRFALLGEGDIPVTAFSWENDSLELRLAGFLSDDLLVGQLVGQYVPPPGPQHRDLTTVLVDLTSHRVHPVAGLDEIEVATCHCLWFARAGESDTQAVVRSSSLTSR